MNRETLAVGSCVPFGSERHTRTCGRCGCTVYFKDHAATRCTGARCVECFLEDIAALPEKEKLQFLVTPENADAMRQYFPELFPGHKPS